MKDQETNRKRKNIEYQEDSDFLALSLSYPSRRSKVKLSEEPLPPAPTESTPLPTTLPQQQDQLQEMVSQSLSMETLLSQPPPLSQFPLRLSASHPRFYNFASVKEASSHVPVVYTQEPVYTPPSSAVVAGPSRPSRVRRNPAQAPREGKSEIVPPPFPWATTHRATVHSFSYLMSKQIVTITGDVQCKRCERQYEIAYDLKDKFIEIWKYISANKSSMHERAPAAWMNPALPKCKFCNQENSAKPVISDKKKSINWLFLLLGGFLGCCTLEQLKYFCKHTKNHRTGAKDRVLYLTYLGICKQLDPNGPFER